MRYINFIQLLKNSEQFYNYKEDFITRQLLFQEQALKRKAELESKANAQHSFEPSLNLVSRQLAETERPTDFEEKIRKVAVVDLEMKESKLHQLRQAELAKYSFKPEINRTSEQIAEKTRDPSKLTDWQEKERKRIEKLKVKRIKEGPRGRKDEGMQIQARANLDEEVFKLRVRI